MCKQLLVPSKSHSALPLLQLPSLLQSRHYIRKLALKIKLSL